MESKTRALLRKEKMEITLATLLQMFIATKQIEGKSPKTIRWYESMVSRFISFVGNGEPAKLGSLTIDSARAFVAHLQETSSRYNDHPSHPVEQGGLSAYTIHGYIRALMGFPYRAWRSTRGR